MPTIPQAFKQNNNTEFLKDSALTDAKGTDPSAFSLLNRVYESDLAWWLKNDLACRILTLRYHSEATSILLYDGLYDKLVNNGSYIRPRKLRLKEENDILGAEKSHFLDHVAFYDFLYYKFQYSGIPNKTMSDIECQKFIEEFMSERNTYFNYRFDMDLLTNEFVNNCLMNSIRLACRGPETQRPKSVVGNKGRYKLDRNSFYNYYKRYFKQKEKYKIAAYKNEHIPGNLSGYLYQMVRDGEFKMPNAEKFFIREAEFKNEKGHKLKINDNARKYLVDLASDEIGLLPANDLDYIGLPLWSNDRCIGVIRMLFAKDMKKNPFKAKDRKKNERFKSIRHAMEMLATFIDSEYSVTYEDDLSYDTTISPYSKDKKADVHKSIVGYQKSTESIPSNNPIQEQIFRNQYCSGIRRAMDALGCTLRYVDDTENRAKLMGYSDDSVGFSQFVTKYLIPAETGVGQDGLINHDGKFIKAITKHFRQSNNEHPKGVLEKYTLVAISTDVENWSNTYFYQHAHKRRIRMTTEDFLFASKRGKKETPDVRSMLNPGAVKGLQSIQMPENEFSDDSNITYNVKGKYVLIVDIPKSYVDGILVVTNSENRPFRLFDVEFVHSELDRMSLEQRKAEQIALQTANEYLANYWHMSNNITIFVNSEINKIKNKLESGRIDAHVISNIINQGKWMRLASEKLNQGHNYLRSQAAKKFEEYLDKEWDICLKIQFYIEILTEASSLFRQLKSIDLLSELPPEKFTINKNENFVTMCIFNYLDNAIKYSFNEVNRIKEQQWIEAGTDLRSQLEKIIVRLYYDKEDLICSVQSFGLEVLDPEKVFEFQTSSSDTERSLNFLKRNNPKNEKGGSSLKLFEKSTKKGITTLQQVMKRINCVCACEKNGCITTFKLVIRQPKKNKVHA